MNELHKQIQTRLEQVTNRLKALNTERNILISEEEHLTRLMELYKNLPYDPIEEERRVTSALLHAEEPAKPPGGRRQKGVSQYDEPFEIIFTTLKNPVSLEQIQKGLKDITGKELTDKNIDRQIWFQIKQKHIAKISKGFYRWVGGNIDAGTKTVPDGGCPKTQEP